MWANGHTIHLSNLSGFRLEFQSAMLLASLGMLASGFVCEQPDLEKAQGQISNLLLIAKGCCRIRNASPA
jgi:hypothetical protein